MNECVRWFFRLFFLFTCMHVLMRVYLYVRLCVCVLCMVCVCFHVCMSLCMYFFLYVCLCVFIHASLCECMYLSLYSCSMACLSQEAYHFYLMLWRRFDERLLGTLYVFTEWIKISLQYSIWRYSRFIILIEMIVGQIVWNIAAKPICVPYRTAPQLSIDTSESIYLHN